MSNHCGPQAPIVTKSALDHGDELARTGDWPGAIAQWRNALDSRDGVQASRRIQWFLDATNDGRDLPRPGPIGRRRAYQTFLAAAAVAVLGTVVTLFGIGRSGIDSTFIAFAAWACFAIATALTLLFARLLGSPSRDVPSMSSRDAVVTAAMDAASLLDQPPK